MRVHSLHKGVILGESDAEGEYLNGVLLTPL